MPTHRDLPIDWQAVHARRRAEVDAAERRARGNRRRRAAGMPPLPPLPPTTGATSDSAPPPGQRPAASRTGARRRSRVLDICAGVLLGFALLAIFAVIARDHADPGYFAAHRAAIGEVLSVLVGVAGIALYCNRDSSR